MSEHVSVQSAVHKAHMVLRCLVHMVLRCHFSVIKMYQIVLKYGKSYLVNIYGN